MTGQVVGPYRVLAKLGEGGMGEVFLAEDTRLRRRVALKAVAARHAAQPEARQRLLREARAVAALNHPNIAAIHDVIEVDDNLCIVMEFVDGTSLDEVVRSGPLPVRRALRIGIELSEAVATAHDHGVVHRDLKPSNVRLTTTGHVKVLDFGLARTLQIDDGGAGDGADGTTTALTKVHQFIGTPAYMAPEQLRGERGDQHSDVYGLGVVLFELLTGTRPFRASSTLDLAVQALTRGVPDVRALRPDTPADLAAIVARATARDAHDRIASARELCDLLRDVYREQSADATPSPSPGERDAWPALTAASPPPATMVPAAVTVTTSWRNRALAVLAAVLLVAIAAFAAWPRLAPSRAGAVAPRPSTIAVLPVAAPAGSTDLQSAAAGLGEIIAANLSLVPGLQVLSRGDTTGALGTARDVARLVRDLAPTCVVSAAVDGAPPAFHLQVNLLDAKGTVAWQSTYEGRVDDPFGLPARVSLDLGRAMAATGVLDARALATVTSRFQDPPTSEREAWAHYADALRFLDRPDIQGNVARATTLLERAVQKDPGFATGWAALASAYSAQYDETKDQQWPPRVLQANLEALRLEPDRAETRVALAQMYQNTGNYDRAIDELHRAAAMAPANDTPLRLLGGLYTDVGKYDEAGVALKQAIALRPGYWRNWSFLGYAYFKAGRHDDAIGAYQRLLELQPDNSRGHAALGTVLHEAGRDEEARGHYLRALELAPTASAWSNLGTLDYFSGRYAEAIEEYRAAIGLRPNNATTQRNLGDAMQAAGRQSDAARAYTAARTLLLQQLATNPRDGAGLSTLSVVEAKLGRLPDARRHSAEALALLPDSKEALYHASTVAAIDGRPDDAAVLLGKALDRGFSTSHAARDPDLANVRLAPAVRDRLAPPPRRKERHDGQE